MLTTPGVGYNCTLLSATSRGAALVNATEPKRRYASVYVGVLQATRSLVGVANCQETVNYQYVHSMEYFTCFPWEVAYELNVSYKENIQDIRLKQQTFLRPIEWPQFPDTGLLSASYTETNYWAYQALADLVGQHFKGGIWIPHDNAANSSSTLLAYSSLVDIGTAPDNPNRTVTESTVWPKLNITRRLVELVRNLSISLLAENSLHIHDTVPAICTIETPVNRWIYNASTLWAAYGSIIVAALVGTLAGGVAIFMNGMSSDVSFSRILCTTRNPRLDWAVVGTRFGTRPLPEELERLKLKFGEIKSHGHVGFGVEEDVVELKKYQCEARLA